MQGLVGFLASKNGRIARAVVGLVLIVLGLFAATGTAQIVLVVVGLIPLAAGLFDFCLVAAVLGMPLKGEDLRRKLR